MPPEPEIARLLAAARAGDRAAEQTVWGLLYEDVTAMARRLKRRLGNDLSLDSTELTHEAFLKLARGLPPDGSIPFRCLLARVIRQVIIDLVRQRQAEKRGGDRVRVTLPSASQVPGIHSAVDAGALYDALERLEGRHPRQASVVVLRFFSDLTAAETATALGVSRETVNNDWRFARAFLARELAVGEAS